MAKPLANGYPIGAVMMREEIAQVMSVGKLGNLLLVFPRSRARPCNSRDTRDNFRWFPTSVCNRTPCITTSLGQGVH